MPELQLLVEEFPLRERLRIQLMVALHRSGRSVEALVSYAGWRDTLTESWGIQPGPVIQRVSDEIAGHTTEALGAAVSTYA